MMESMKRGTTVGSGRMLTVGATGLVAAVTLLVVLGLAVGGVVVAPKVYTAPYRGSAGAPNWSTSGSGCATARLTTPAWHPRTGEFTTATADSARACGKPNGYLGGQNYASSSGTVQLTFPLPLTLRGNHSISSTWTIKVASSWSYSAGTVCPKNVNYYPPLYGYSYAYCQAGNFVSFYMSSYLADLNNNTWGANYSAASVYNDTYYEDWTYCYNQGTPVCSTSTSSSSGSTASINAVGMGAWTWNGSTTVTFWTNATNMILGHHYVLIVNIYASTEAVAGFYSLHTAWKGNAAASLNLASLGHGDTVSSIQIK
ncbi:MAG TPA: hypothetical protein VGV89_06990 [Thermoplasmata archaeon]|nr:hypothetical protein [Thermoplasmata archaeon]